MVQKTSSHYGLFSIFVFVARYGISRYDWPCHNGIAPQYLTQWGRHKMTVFFQVTYWYGFSWMKLYKSRFEFHWSSFPRGPINNIAALSSESIMAILLTHICVTRFQWVKVCCYWIFLSGIKILFKHFSWFIFKYKCILPSYFNGTNFRVCPLQSVRE